MTKEQIVNAKEQIIRDYFDSWVKKDFSKLDQWFEQDMFYR